MTDEQMPQPRKREPQIQESFTVQDVLKLLQAQQEQNAKLMMDFAKELKKPNAREQKELDDKEQRLAQHQEQRLKLAKAEEAGRQARKRSCAHSTTHGGTGVVTHQWRAQVHAPSHCDPYFVPTCTQCLSPLEPIRATTEMLTNGVNLDLYKTVDMEALLEWAPLSWVGHEDRHPKSKVA